MLWQTLFQSYKNNLTSVSIVYCQNETEILIGFPKMKVTCHLCNIDIALCF